jgi:hypothetical protein
MKTFNDLVFKEIEDGIRIGVVSRIHFDNGYGASVVSHSSSYGGSQGLYELAVLLGDEIDYNNPVSGNDVIGYLKEEEVTDLLIQIQQL